MKTFLKEVGSLLWGTLFGNYIVVFILSLLIIAVLKGGFNQLITLIIR